MPPRRAAPAPGLAARSRARKAASAAPEVAAPPKVTGPANHKQALPTDVPTQSLATEDELRSQGPAAARRGAPGRYGCTASPASTLAPTQRFASPALLQSQEILSPAGSLSQRPTAMDAPQATEILQPTEMLQPTENLQPTEMMQPTEMLQPTQLFQATEMLQSTESLQPTHMLQPTEILRPTEILQPTEMLQPTKGVQSTLVLPESFANGGQQRILEVVDANVKGRDAKGMGASPVSGIATYRRHGKRPRLLKKPLPQEAPADPGAAAGYGGLGASSGHGQALELQHKKEATQEIAATQELPRSQDAGAQQHLHTRFRSVGGCFRPSKLSFIELVQQGLQLRADEHMDVPSEIVNFSSPKAAPTPAPASEQLALPDAAPKRGHSEAFPEDEELGSTGVHAPEVPEEEATDARVQEHSEAACSPVKIGGQSRGEARQERKQDDLGGGFRDSVPSAADAEASPQNPLPARSMDTKDFIRGVLGLVQQFQVERCIPVLQPPPAFDDDSQLEAAVTQQIADYEASMQSLQRKKKAIVELMGSLQTLL